ncbi:HAD family hydrolase [Candidatus Woesearchaeota archaeon]|nr:HAD family hydrolase [Candidatus Woesearchaeota archaeon]
MDKKKLICLDLDNTLILSDKSHVEAYSYALKKLGYNGCDERHIVKFFGRPKLEIAEILMPGSNLIERKELIRMHNRYLIHFSYKYAKKISGVENALKRLKKKYLIAILSNTEQGSVMYLLKGSKLDPKLFDLIIGSDKVKHSKPYPDEILKAKKLLKHKPEYMVGDSVYDIIAARKAKVKGIGVLTGHYSKTVLMKHKPAAVLKSIRELPRFLKI